MAINVVCEGDSIMKGYPLLPAEYMPAKLASYLGAGYTVQNIAFENDTLVQIDAEYTTGNDGGSIAEAYDSEADQNILILWGGGNDIHFAQNQVEPAKAAFDSILTKAKATGFDIIYVMDIIQRGANMVNPIATWRSEAAAINAHFASKVVYPDIILRYPVIDLFDSFDWDVEPWTSTVGGASVRAEYEDWAHPSAATHDTIAADLACRIELDQAKYIARTVGGTKRLLYSAYEGKTFSLDGVNYYKEESGVCTTTDAIALTSYSGA